MFCSPQSQLSRPRRAGHLILDLSDGRDLQLTKHISSVRHETGKKSHWPFRVGWRPVNNGTPTHVEWHNPKNRKKIALEGRPTLYAPTRSHSDDGFHPHLVGGIPLQRDFCSTQSQLSRPLRSRHYILGCSALLAPPDSHSDEEFLPHLVGWIAFIKRFLFSPIPAFPPSLVRPPHSGPRTTKALTLTSLPNQGAGDWK